jgi:FkbH-like protein
MAVDAGGAGSETTEERGAASPAPVLGDPIKLVVWDLDDTLWRGTLSEEEVQLSDERAELVRTLNRRGIVNAICSKNDPDRARERLELAGLWDEFVFPSIAWEPKGARVAQIIADMGLRARNVLFVDDNVGNLQEALHFSPGLQLAEPELLDRLLELPQAAGKDDSALTRLAQYRVLERKRADRGQATGSNEDFLRSCDVRVALSEPGRAEAARVLELVNRSNQLNFTKTRLTEQQLESMLAEEGRETRAVHVSDRYGDYGLAGFYSLRDGRLSDLVFSCRILHMGVEQWLYERLGRPEIEIAGEVASSLEREQPVDWVTLQQDGVTGPPETAGRRRAVHRRSRVLLKGGCDLFLLNGFLGGSIETDFTYPSETGAEVHSDHTEVLRQSSRQTLERYGEVIDRLPFLDRAAFATPLVRRPKAFGTVIYSVLMDYTQGIYRHRESDFRAPFWQYDVVATDPASWPDLERRWSSVGVDRDFLRWFSENFEPEGPLGAERFQENIRLLRGLLAKDATLVLINGAEVAQASEREPGRELHHRQMNEALEQVVAELPATVICDVREFVTSTDDLLDNLRHYNRQTYLRMAESLKALAGEELRIEQRPLLMRLYKARRRLERNARRAAVRYRLR